MLHHLHRVRYVAVRDASESPAQLVGLLLCVFVRESLQNDVHGVHSAVVRTGLNGLSGHKGAVAMRLELLGQVAYQESKVHRKYIE